MRFRRLTIINAQPPRTADVNLQLQWLGGSLGLFNPRDKDKSCFRIFITLLKSAKAKRELSSDDLASMSGLSRGTVVHHLNKLISAGLVESYRNKYMLRVENLSSLIEKLQGDLEATLKELRLVAEAIDKKLEL